MSIVLQNIPLDEKIRDFRLPRIGDPLSPTEAKELAVQVAYRGIGRVGPNPLVGAVIVSEDHRFISAGAHEKVGDHHAEINALKNVPVGCGLDSATMYVTLEPCAHQGRTPACAPIVANSGIRKVIYGLIDPNPKVSGKGAAFINQHGVTCTLDTSWHSAKTPAEVFLWQMREQKPFVAMKCATSLDGQMAYQGDSRAWITGKRARNYGHFLRCYYDAIVVGINTLIADDPKLDTRDALLDGKANCSPIKVVIDPNGRGLAEHANWHVLTSSPEKTIWITKPTVKLGVNPAELGARHLTLDPVTETSRFSAIAIQQALYAEGITSILLEGGAGLYEDFVKERTLQRIHWFQAGKILGTQDTIPAVKLPLAGLKAETITRLDDDWLIDLKS